MKTVIPADGERDFKDIRGVSWRETIVRKLCFVRYKKNCANNYYLYLPRLIPSAVKYRAKKVNAKLKKII